MRVRLLRGRPINSLSPLRFWSKRCYWLVCFHLDLSAVIFSVYEIYCNSRSGCFDFGANLRNRRIVHALSLTYRFMERHWNSIRLKIKFSHAFEALSLMQYTVPSALMPSLCAGSSRVPPLPKLSTHTEMVRSRSLGAFQPGIIHRVPAQELQSAC